MTDSAREELAMEGPFSGFRVIELAQGVAGPYCGKLLADLGADVIKVEPPAGDRTRRLNGTDPAKTLDPEGSPLFLYCNTSKRGIVLDLDDGRDRETFAALLGDAAVLIADREPPVETPDDLIVAAVTPYGLEGPRAAAPAGELTLAHGGGLVNQMPARSRDIDRAPVTLGGQQAGYHGGLVTALAVAALLYERRRGAAGGRVDVSIQDVMLSLVAPLLASARYHETTWSRVPDRPPAMGRLETSDGYVILNAFDDHHFALFRELMGSPSWCEGDEWLDMAYRSHHMMEIAPHVDAWALDQKRDDLYHRAAQLGIPVGPIHDAADVMAYRQYEARDYFTEVDHPRTGTKRYAGWPYRMGASKPRVSRPAPLLGQHSAEIRSELNGGAPAGAGTSVASAHAETAAAPSPPSLPLEGIRVAEFAWVWAGPYAGVLLSALGADVIKVEGPRRLDLTRRSVVWPRSNETPRKIGPDAGMAFNTMNLNKRSLTLDLSQREGRELALRLAAECDVVYDNMRPGAMVKLGLDYENLSRANPELIVASSSGRGHGGPETEYLGYAMVHQGVAGGAYISGYPDDHPTHSGGDVDLMNAITLAFSIVAALHHRRQTGEGQFIDYSQCEGVSSILGEVLLEYEMTGRIPERAGNAHRTSAPHSVYRCWGIDRWLAIEVHSDDEFRRLAATMGRPELKEDDRFATAAARKRNEAELDEIVGAWTRERDRDWMARELCTAGVAAAPSRDARDLYADSHLRARGSFVTVEHPEWGDLELVGPPFRIEGRDLTPRRAPLLGEHTDAILGDLLGLSNDELADYRRRGIVG
ncbi:MAG: CoA transferase [Acidobacteria bacterium]|nr:CoA transferase [Acidobacteriota bacterium]